MSGHLSTFLQDDRLRQRERDDRHHEGEHGAQRGALLEQSLHDRDDAGRVGVHGDAEQHGERHAPPGVGAHDRRHEVLGHVAVDDGADGDAGEHVGPHLADDVLDGLPGVGDAAGPVELLAVLGIAHADLAHPVLDVAVHAQASDHPAGDDGDEQAGDEVEGGDLPAEQPVEQHQGDLVDHRRGDQEREGDAERDAGLDEADEQRHRRAAAERRDDAEAGGHHVAGGLTSPRRGPACAAG